MEYLIVILIIIIVLLIIYLLLLKREIKHITNSVNNMDEYSNQLINKQLTNKDTYQLIKSINNLLKNIREERWEYEGKRRELNKMMMNISHDLRTPLTSILGYLDLINNSKLTEKEKEHSLKIIEERITHLEKLINSFFEFSKIVTTNKEIEYEKVNIIAVLEETLAHYYDDFIINSRTIKLTNNIKRYNIYSNYDMLIRVFDNLIINAYKHSNDNLLIKVIKDEQLTITFKNKLINNELDIDHIFDEFYTMDISRTKGNTGLGLAIVKQFIERLNGSIKASKKNGYLTITITFND